MFILDWKYIHYTTTYVILNLNYSASYFSLLISTTITNQNQKAFVILNDKKNGEDDTAVILYETLSKWWSLKKWITMEQLIHTCLSWVMILYLTVIMLISIDTEIQKWCCVFLKIIGVIHNHAAWMTENGDKKNYNWKNIDDSHFQFSIMGHSKNEFFTNDDNVIAALQEIANNKQ